MKDQNARRRHDWEITHTTKKHVLVEVYIETEHCTNCNAKRVMQYLPGMILDSDPKPVPKFCPVLLGKNGSAILN